MTEVPPTEAPTTDDERDPDRSRGERPGSGPAGTDADRPAPSRRRVLLAAAGGVAGIAGCSGFGGGGGGGSGGGLPLSKPSNVSSECSPLDSSFTAYGVAGTNYVYSFEYPESFRTNDEPISGVFTTVKAVYDTGDESQILTVAQGDPYDEPLNTWDEEIGTIQYGGESRPVGISGDPSADGGSYTINTFLPHETSAGTKYVSTTVTVNLVGPCDDLMGYLGRKIVASYEPNPDTTFTV